MLPRPGLWRNFLTSKEGILLTSSATLRFLSYPPFPFGFLIFPSFALLFFAIDRKTPFQTLKLTYFWGLLSNALLLYWICWATLPGGIAAILPLGVYPAMVFVVSSSISKRSYVLSWLSLPCLWVGMEYLRSIGEFIFPWTNLGYSQSFYLPIIQFITFTGIYGLSFWVMVISLLLFGAIRSLMSSKLKNSLSYVLPILVLVLLPYIYGRVAMKDKVEPGGVKVALLQGNIGQGVKWNPKYVDFSFETFFDLSREAAEGGAELIVWPETAAPCYLAHDQVRRRLVQNLVDELKVPFLVGAPEYKRLDSRKFVYYNAVFFFEPNRNKIRSYYKNRLVPFSERIPFSGQVKILSDIHLGQADFSPGRELTIFDHPEGDFGVLICFESAFPNLVRGFVKKGADFLVNITNDQWFGKTSGPHQHAAIVTFRAVENRIFIARCANTGVSMFVDRFGRSYQRTELFTRSLVVGEVHPKGPETFYTRHGDLFVYGCISLALLFFLVSFGRKARRADSYVIR